MKKKHSQYIAGSIPADAIDDYITPGLFWTTEKPTEPGTYWVHAKNRYGDVFTETANVCLAGKEVFLKWPVDGIEREENFSAEDVTHWLGPLPEPEPPEDIK